jgi:trehalose-phosphatase
VHTRRLPKDQYENVFTRADILAVPWIAENLVRRLEGNAVVEYLPNIHGHKGDATRWIAQDVESKFARRSWVAYIGDDITDEDAFREIEEGDGDGIAVLVGLRPTAACYKLDGIPDVDRFLRWLVAEGNVRRTA